MMTGGLVAIGATVVAVSMMLMPGGGVVAFVTTLSTVPSAF